MVLAPIGFAGLFYVKACVSKALTMFLLSVLLWWCVMSVMSGSVAELWLVVVGRCRCASLSNQRQRCQIISSASDWRAVSGCSEL